MLYLKADEEVRSLGGGGLRCISGFSLHCRAPSRPRCEVKYQCFFVWFLLEKLSTKEEEERNQNKNAFTTTHTYISIHLVIVLSRLESNWAGLDCLFPCPPSSSSLSSSSFSLKKGHPSCALLCISDGRVCMHPLPNRSTILKASVYISNRHSPSLPLSLSLSSTADSLHPCIHPRPKHSTSQPRSPSLPSNVKDSGQHQIPLGRGRPLMHIRCKIRSRWRETAARQQQQQQQRRLCVPASISLLAWH